MSFLFFLISTTKLFIGTWNRKYEKKMLRRLQTALGRAVGQKVGIERRSHVSEKPWIRNYRAAKIYEVVLRTEVRKSSNLPSNTDVVCDGDRHG